MENRRKLQNLRTKILGKKPLPSNIYEGEIAVNYAAGGETLMIKNTENEIIEFGDKKFVESSVNSRMFIGTQEEYDIAYAEGKVAVGALVVILDENETNSDAATAMLGKAIIGTLLLGRA